MIIEMRRYMTKPGLQTQFLEVLPEPIGSSACSDRNEDPRSVSLRGGAGLVLRRLLTAAWALALGALICAAVLQCWCWRIGLPGHLSAAAGAGNFTGGLFCLGFGLSLSGATAGRRLALMKEWGLFAFLFVAATPMFFWTLELLAFLNLSPHYVEQGHGYIIAGATGPIVAMLGFVYVAYGAATRQRYAR